MSDDENNPKLYESGSAAVGHDPDGRPTGSAAFGGADSKLPLRGALLFGNDPKGAGSGSAAIGESDEEHPLRGALLFGNDPEGGLRGSDAIGEADEEHPLRGALLFGNDPMGEGRGSESFGSSSERFPNRGAMAFGAAQGIREKLERDAIGYDFVGRIFTPTTSGLAEFKLEEGDRQRQRVLNILKKTLGIKDEKLRTGLSERAIPWGRLKNDPTLDFDLAVELRGQYSLAPKNTLGIAQTQNVLESLEYMHSFDLVCEWDLRPWSVQVLRREKMVASIRSAMHKNQPYFVVVSGKNEVVAYVDALVPNRGGQRAKIRTANAELVATFELELEQELVGQHKDEQKRRFRGTLFDRDDNVLFQIAEEASTPRIFRANCFQPGEDGIYIGRIEDFLSGGKIRSRIEIDVSMPMLVAWAAGLILADLSRIRRGGWPGEVNEKSDEEPVSDIERALGPRKRR